MKQCKTSGFREACEAIEDFIAKGEVCCFYKKKKTPLFL